MSSIIHESANNTSLKWEVVGGGKRGNKKSSPEQKPTKEKTKAIVEKMPKIETMQPIRLEPTAFNLIKDELADDDTIKQTSKQTTKKTTQQAVSPKLNKSQQSKKPVAQNTLKRIDNDFESVAQSLNIDEFKSEYAQFQALYPNAELLALRHMVTYLNLKLSVVPDVEPTFQGEFDKDYPSSKLDKKVRDFFRELIENTNKSECEKFFDYLINEIISDTKLTCHHGFKIALQLLIKKHADIALKAPNKFNDYITMNNRNKQLKCLIYFWSIGQCGYIKLAYGLRIWFNGMIQYIHLKSFSYFVISYLNNLLEYHKNNIINGKYSNEELLNVNDYFALYDLITDKQSLLITKELNTKLIQSFNLIKTLYRSQSKSNISDYFEMMLSRLPLEKTNDKQREILDLLKLNLNHGKDTYAKWRQIYLKYLPQSKLLLNEIKTNWNSYRLYNFNDLKQTINYFESNSTIFLNSNAKKSTTKSKSTTSRNSQAIDLLNTELDEFNKLAKVL